MHIYFERFTVFFVIVTPLIQISKDTPRTERKWSEKKFQLFLLKEHAISNQKKILSNQRKKINQPSAESYVAMGGL